MADNSTLNLMLKIRTDLADASRALQGLAGDVEDVGSAATTSSQKLSTTARAQDSVAESARSQAQAEQNAASATSLLTPAISNITRPGFTTAAQYSTVPLPLPIRVSAGFAVIGLSGKILIQTLPPRLM